MSIRTIITLAFLVCLTCPSSIHGQYPTDRATDDVIINEMILSKSQLQELKRIYGVDPVAGAYWYDTISGLFGYVGGPVIGAMYPGHQFGTLKRQASRGRSRVVVNRRELQKKEAVYIANLFGYAAPVKGNYWMLADGTFGKEGSYYAIGNVYKVISSKNRFQKSSGDSFWQKGLYSAGNYYTGSNGQPSAGYVSVPGYGPVGYGLD